MDKKESRLRRGRQTRIKIAQQGVNRLSVHRTNLHIYANLISPDAKVYAIALRLKIPQLYVAMLFEPRYEVLMRPLVPAGTFG